MLEYHKHKKESRERGHQNTNELDLRTMAKIWALVKGKTVKRHSAFSENKRGAILNCCTIFLSNTRRIAVDAVSASIPNGESVKAFMHGKGIGLGDCAVGQCELCCNLLILAGKLP